MNIAIEFMPGNEPAVVFERRKRWANFQAQHADASDDTLYTMAEKDWSRARELFPTREEVMHALFTISRLK